MDVGVRELRDGLSRHLALVRQGHTINITDHGRLVARIVPVGTPTKLEEWIASGAVKPPRRQRQPLPTPVTVGAPVSKLVSDQRR